MNAPATARWLRWPCTDPRRRRRSMLGGRRAAFAGAISARESPRPAHDDLVLALSSDEAAMASSTTTQQSGPPSLPATLSLGPVHLTVADLARSIAWYQSSLGLYVDRREDGTAELGDGTAVVVVLKEDRQARRPGREAGLYHYALLYPDREELARAAVRLTSTRTPIQGASDHGTHEAIYLGDVDGIGIELAADRPREQWPPPEQEFTRGGPLPLDVENLLSTVAGESPTDMVRPGLRVGHLHLHVGSVERGLEFYRDLLGFEVRAQMPSAAFVSAGGYHHHLAFNTWRGEGLPPASDHAVGLRVWTIELESPSDVAAVQERLETAHVAVRPEDRGFTASDPWRIPVRFVARSAT
jgi:catechol 2,3-dioxygenase